MSAITISRQMGSQGDALAAQVAQRLGWRPVGRELINQAAVGAGVPDVALAELDELGIFGLHPSAEAWQAYHTQIEQSIRTLAAEGQVVIVGRGGQMVLRDRPDVLHVRVIAPFDHRVARLQATRHLTADSAAAIIEKSMEARARYIIQSYDIVLDDPSIYHLIINTGLLGLSQAVDLVVQAYRGLSAG
ncbi:MAG: cytidylate kinase-like family protein [Anaerolineae bacterium]|nr:cytidylate kinase-like family protein [Anaerolineae bacterium]